MSTATAVRDGNVRMDWAPTMIAGVLIRVRSLSDIPATLRDHAHRVVPKASVGDWYTVGQFRDSGQSPLVWLVAKRKLDGTMAYGTEAE